MKYEKIKTKDMHCEYLLNRHQRIVNEGLKKISKNGYLGIEKSTKPVIGIVKLVESK